MKKNLGLIDRLARVLIAVVIGILFFTGILTGTLGIVLMILAGVFLLTAILGICPLYLAARFSTLKG
jgi:hypothetical protein